jgi:hypothetical protein
MKVNRLGPAVAVALVALASGCTEATAPAPAPAPPCSSAVRRDVLPEWARTGFSDPSPSGIPYVLGDRGSILGVIFGYPLTAPPASSGRANKILWVADPAAPGASPDSAAPNDLRIDARLTGSTEVVHRTVPGGPGPSVVDLPRPGCWQLTLTWPGHTDTLDLRYEPPTMVTSVSPAVRAG